jgi:hypothetical protein
MDGGSPGRSSREAAVQIGPIQNFKADEILNRAMRDFPTIRRACVHGYSYGNGTTTSPISELNELYARVLVPLLHANVTRTGRARNRNANQHTWVHAFTLLMEKDKRNKEGTCNFNL